MGSDKRLIEGAFPIEEVSEQGRRDKYKRQITGIHTWWARKPLGPSRAITYAALVSASPVNGETVNSNSFNLPEHNFIIELSNWENALKPLWISEARKQILESHDGRPPKVLDPFGGGGSIPLEVLRLGCETYSCDLNPVAVLIQKCTLEYPQKYGNRLRDDVHKWGNWVIERTTAELEPFYPKALDDSTPFAYIWARTLPCQNLGCAATIPLIHQFWLAPKKEITFFPYEADGEVAFRIVGPGYEPMPSDFDPAKGTIANANVTCPLCRNTIPGRETRRLFQEGMAGERMLAVVTHHPKVKGKRYRLATSTDVAVFKDAHRRLTEKRARLFTEWGIDPVPDEPTPVRSGGGAERFVARCPNYNLNTYGDLFNARQQLALITLTENVRAAHSEMSQHAATDYSCAVVTYLGLWLDEMANNSSNLCRWRPIEIPVQVFSLPGLITVYDYAESNPLRVAGNRLKTLLKPMEHLSQMGVKPATVKRASATELPYPDASFDAVLTDPPYYNNTAYSYLSDFFYVWLKRSIGDLYPELFETVLTPKGDEIVAYGHREGGLEAGKRFFEERLSKAFAEMYRVLKPGGIAVIVYAHKSTSGWETLINALLDSGLVITAAWPIDTEMKSSLWSMNVASLDSSIYMVVRKREREPFGLYREIQKELEVHLQEKLFMLWEAGFSGAGLFIAAIGSGIEVFGKYREILDDDDTLIRADRMIQDIREILERFDREQTDVASTQRTRFYLRWRREYGTERVLFDKARTLALSLGIELAEEREGSFIQQEKTNVRVLGPHERELADVRDSEDLIDVLHHVLHLWRHGNREAMIQRLAGEGIGLKELIWEVARAVSLELPPESEEQQWLEGWLADREAIRREVLEVVDKPRQHELF